MNPWQWAQQCHPAILMHGDILTVSKSLAYKAGAEVRRGSISGTHLI